MNPNRPFFGFVSLFFLFVLLNVGIAFSAASCNDSDGGNNLDKKGSVSGMTSEGQFFCLGIPVTYLTRLISNSLSMFAPPLVTK